MDSGPCILPEVTPESVSRDSCTSRYREKLKHAHPLGLRVGLGSTYRHSCVFRSPEVPPHAAWPLPAPFFHHLLWGCLWKALSCHFHVSSAVPRPPQSHMAMLSITPAKAPTHSAELSVCPSSSATPESQPHWAETPRLTRWKKSFSDAMGRSRRRPIPSCHSHR